MVAQPTTSYITPQEYLAWERDQEETHEYHNGVIVAMSGGTRTHAVIIGNLIHRIAAQLDKRPCVTLGGNLRVHIEECNRYFYPDVMVVCGTPILTDGHRDNIDNPDVVVEVLSDSTEHIDRTIKLDCYWALTTVHTYLIVSQNEPRIEKYSKISGKNRWELTVYTDAADVVQLPEIECELRANEVYRRIEFASPADANDTLNNPSL
jgi:Uma2 family endonuclease